MGWFAVRINIRRTEGDLKKCSIFACAYCSTPNVLEHLQDVSGSNELNVQMN